MADHLATRTGRLDGASAAAVRGVAAAARAHDGIEALGEQTLLDLATPDDRILHLLTAAADPERDEAPSTSTARRAAGLIGYAQVDLRVDPPSAELVVTPDARGRGLGRTLLTTARAAATQAGHRAPAVWAHGDLPAARALAASTGLSVHRELWRMVRDLRGDEAEPAPPAGLRVRPFAVGQDEPALLAVNARAFDWHPEQGRLTTADLEARQQEPWFDPERLVLVERDGTLQAFLWLKVEPGSDEGELYVLAVDPAAQGQGLGRYLTDVTLARLAALGLARVVLYTEAGNAAAVRTYRAAGFTRDRVDVQYR